MDSKGVAAVAGVLAYLRGAGSAAGLTREVSARDAAGGGEAGRAGNTGLRAGNTGLRPSLWALYGRQALMSQRIRMQARRRA